MTTNRAKAKSRRFRNRHLELLDIVGRFEAGSASGHAHAARAVIERVREEGRTFWEEESSQLNRWRDYCNVLWKFIHTSLGERRNLRKQDITEALREFFREYEHSTYQMYKMLYGTSDDPKNDLRIKQVLDWFPLIFRCSTYAITSYWLDDKTAEIVTEISWDPATGERSQKTTILKEMKVPKKHRRGAKDLR